jgi:hypothetical protein
MDAEESERRAIATLDAVRQRFQQRFKTWLRVGEFAIVMKPTKASAVAITAADIHDDAVAAAR